MPATATWLVAAEVKVHDSVELPEPVTLVGDSAQDVLFVARFTTPLKPWSAVTVIVEVAAVFVTALTVVGLAAMVKS